MKKIFLINYSKILNLSFILLFTIIFSNLNVYSQSWELDCPTDECLDNQSVPWNYVDELINYAGPESPDCWIRVFYRWRSDLVNCPNSGCEFEVRFVLVSGSCFYPYTEPDPPFTTYPPILDFTDDEEIWEYAMLQFFEKSNNPCLLSTPNNCITIKKFKSALCKKLVDNQDGTFSLTFCEDFNSCCEQEVEKCFDSQGNVSSIDWETIGTPIDNCHLNEDEDCHLNCFDYGDGGWIPPKIIINNEEEHINQFKFSFNNNKLKYDVGNTGYMLTISSIEGYELYNGYIENVGEINITTPGNKIIIRVYNDNFSKTIKLIEE